MLSPIMVDSVVDTPFVGRENELKLLLEQAENAREGKGGSTFLVGEAFMRADEPGERLAELFG